MTEIKLVMPAHAGIRTRPPAAKTQNLDFGGRRNGGSSYLTPARRKRLALPFLLVFGLTLARAEFSTAQTLEKVRIGMPSLSLSFIAPQVGYARGFFREEGIDAEIIRIATNVGIVAVTTKEIGYIPRRWAPDCAAPSKACRSKWLRILMVVRSMFSSPSQNSRR